MVTNQAGTINKAVQDLFQTVCYAIPQTRNSLSVFPLLYMTNKILSVYILVHLQVHSLMKFNAILALVYMLLFCIQHKMLLKEYA